VSSVDPVKFPQLYRTQSAFPTLGDTTVAISKSYHEDHHKNIGDTLVLTTPIGHRVIVSVAGVVEDKGHLTADLTITNRLAAREFGETHDAFALVGVDDGADVKTVQHAITQQLKADFPQVEVLTAKEFKDNQAKQINQLLALIYALLSLSIIVSLFGIVNTLVLSIHERTRELGMLRAIGTSRRQLKRIVRYEAVITSMIGGVLGSVLGVVLAVLVSRPLDDFVLAIPFLTLLLLLVLAGFAGVVAAILPARRAARLDVLEALAYE
jgi:putative ABC transport system permease protein